MRVFRNPRAMLPAALAAAALAGAGGAAGLYAAFGPEAGPTVVRQVTVADSAEPAASTSTTVGDVYERSYKSVVEIAVTGAGSSGQGSGFVYDGNGHVVTNHHVVDGAQSISVTLWDGKRYDATLVGSDPSTDLAVIDVDAPIPALRPLVLADSSALRVGDAVVAIGSPFGLEQTLTSGIVSALHRQISAPNSFAIDDAIQTDAAINHGNSGGPLLDLSGKVVGVNSQIESESGGNDGIGFAVPADTVATIASALIADGSVEHAYLGVATDDVESGSGARIAEVRPGTPAAEADLRSGDVVTEVDGVAVDSADELRRAIDDRSPGDRVELTVRRDGGTTTIGVTLDSRPTA